MKFDDLGLSPETLKAVKECGYEEATPIQAGSHTTCANDT